MSVAQTQRKIQSALEEALRSGADEGSKDDLVFGDELERVADNANAEIVRAKRYLDLVVETLAKRGQLRVGDSLSYITRALYGVSTTLAEASRGIGRYYGNPSRRMASRVVTRYLDEDD